MNKYLKSTLVFFSFFLFSLFTNLPFELFDTSIKLLPNNWKAIYLTTMNIIYLGFLLMIYNKDIIKYYQDFKKNGKKYINQTIRYWYFGLIIMIISNMVINFLNPNDLAQNEQAVRELLGIVPLYMIFSTVIYAPLTEEIICRKIIKDIIKNKWGFIIVSAILFGGAHVLASIQTYWDILYIIPYGTLGGIFAYIYYKTNNLFTPIVIHALHNTILITLYLLIL